MDGRDEEVKPQDHASYAEQTQELVVELATQALDGKDRFLSVGGRLTLIEQARQDALSQLTQEGPGSHVRVIAERLNMLNGLKKKIIEKHPGARSMQRRLESPKRKRQLTVR
jgi:hypothetical protein